MPTKSKKSSDPRHDSKKQAAKPQPRHEDIPGLRHAGPTLESDPKYLNRESVGYSTPEAQIAAQGQFAEVSLDASVGELGADITGAYDSSYDRGGAITRMEPLKTRLAGDTSSDPHTDLGPETATKVREGGAKRRSS